MKILHILNHFLPQHIAGTEMYALYLGKELSRQGYQVIYVIPNYGSTQTDEYDYEGFRVIQYAEPSVVDRALQMGKRIPNGLQHFIEVLKKEKPDIVHFHELAGSNGITLHHVVGAKELGFKTVMTIHLARYTSMSSTSGAIDEIFDNKIGSFNYYRIKGFNNTTIELLYPIARLFQRANIKTEQWGKWGTAFAVPQLVERRRSDFYQLMDHCDKVVVIAQWYLKVLSTHRIDSHKLVFIEQGIHSSESCAPVQKSRRGEIRLVFVGRISHFKGVDMLIDTVSSLSTDKILLDLYGDSGEDDSYKHRCYTIAKGKNNIQFLGRLQPEEVVEKLSGYDLLALPSTIHEMAPLVIREAFAAGIPVLASDNMGAREQIQDGINGWLFRMNDKEDLKEKLSMLISHPGKIAEAKKYLPPVRTFEQVAEEYDRLYKEVMSMVIPLSPAG